MKIAVFGGSGFLGSYVVRELIKRKHKVIVYDIKNFKSNSDVIYVTLDILDKKALTTQFEKHKFDIVYNFAGFANLDKSCDYPNETFELNVIGNLNILNAIVKKDIKRFVYASSAYAMSNKGSFYGISKLASEKIVEEYARKFDLQYTILRYGSIYSEKRFDNNYIYNLIEKALEKLSINHQGNGEEVREYIHAFDAASLSVDVIENEKFKNTHLILTGVDKIKRIELFNMIKEITNEPIDISLKKEGYNNHYALSPYSFSPEVSQKLLPNPHIDIGQGILNCIKEVKAKK